MKANRELYPELARAEAKKEPRAAVSHLRYRPDYPHHMWYIDIRQLDTKLEDKLVYSICIIEGYSRAVLFGALSLSKATWAVLRVLYGAVSLFGRPEVIVSDNEKQFTGKDFGRVCRQLEVEHRPIDKGKSYETLIEPFFGVQRRLADFQFSMARTLEGFQAVHDEFISTYNHTEHWALVKEERRETAPAKELSWLKGRPLSQSRIDWIFGTVLFRRKTDRTGYVRVQSWRLYVEEGLPKTDVQLWASEKQLMVEHAKTTLAIYGCRFDRDHKKLGSVEDGPRLFETKYATPQLRLFALESIPWSRVIRLPPPRRLERLRKVFKQLRLAL